MVGSTEQMNHIAAETCTSTMWVEAQIERWQLKSSHPLDILHELPSMHESQPSSSKADDETTVAGAETGVVEPTGETLDYLPRCGNVDTDK